MIRAVFAFVLAFSLADAAYAETPSRGLVEIDGESGTQRVHVEIADEPGEHARGLMYRADLPDSTGMLFLYPRPRRTSFWMKNTLIPLDMLFIGPQGQIVKIERETTPFSLKPISSGEVVVGVLEIAGGASEKLGVRVGDRARWVEFPSQN